MKIRTLFRTLFCVILLAASNMALAEMVNINTANAMTLAENIKGVGVKRGEAIVAYRDEHGPFKSVDELTQVKGIGLALVDKNRENLRVKDK